MPLDVRYRPYPHTTTPTRPAAGEVHVWGVPLDQTAADPAANLDVLTADERARAAGYKIPRIRDQFVACRSTVRRVLGAYLGLEPGRVPIVAEPSGKPALDGYPLYFNLSHTDGLALLAVTAVRVGIDLERVRPVANRDGLVERFFSTAEREQYRSLPADQRDAAFFRGWTCKEAVLKAVGGSVQALDAFDVELDPGRAPAVLSARDPAIAAGGPWTVATWCPADGFAAAVCVETAGPAVVQTDAAG